VTGKGRAVSRPIRVHLTGGERSGWALDADVATTRASLQALGDQVTLTSLEEAEVVHSVWEEPILRLDARRFDGKRVVCHVCNEVMRTFEMPSMARAGERIGLWVPISREAEANLALLGYRSVYIPYTVDTTLFTERIPGGEDRAALRARFGVPRDAYVVGNFMRDSRSNDLSLPKPQKGVELLLGILAGLWSRRLPLHVLLAGPRRHWLRARLREAGIPFTFVGRELAADDVDVNILTPQTVNLLYHLSDLHLVTSRWEGGPRAVLEAGATRTRILSTPVGMAGDILQPECLFGAVDEGIDRVAGDSRFGVLAGSVEAQYRRIREWHVPEANVPLFRELYRGIEGVPVHQAGVAAPARKLPVARRVARRIAAVRTLARTALKLPSRPGDGLCIGLWHEFHKPPYGGGNQFMRALRDALLRQGTCVVSNRMSPSVDVHICNSAWFDVTIFERAASRRPIRMIHRVDGPVALYRGTDWDEDGRIHDLNRKHASATVFQSAFSFRRTKEHGLDFVRPMIIRNASDPAIFHPPRERAPLGGRKIRLISSAWSDNPRKGGALYKWLDDHLDWGQFDYTFVGRIQQSFREIRHLPAQDSRQLGETLRSHDLFITASQSDPCSNALLESLSCGLPALYYQDGGHGELVGFGGLPFTGTGDVLAQLERLTASLEAFRSCIWLPTIDEIARQYLELARLLVDDVP